MNYELAKQLKDAGFPEPDNWEHRGNDAWYNDKGILKANPSSSDDDFYYNPTLSELIAACLEHLNSFNLSYNPENDDLPAGWDAQGQRHNSRLVMHDNNYLTPEEAVANLWLALNKK